MSPTTNQQAKFAFVAIILFLSLSFHISFWAFVVDVLLFVLFVVVVVVVASMNACYTISSIVVGLV